MHCLRAHKYEAQSKINGRSVIFRNRRFVTIIRTRTTRAAHSGVVFDSVVILPICAHGKKTRPRQPLLPPAAKFCAVIRFFTCAKGCISAAEIRRELRLVCGPTVTSRWTVRRQWCARSEIDDAVNRFCNRPVQSSIVTVRVHTPQPRPKRKFKIHLGGPVNHPPTQCRPWAQRLLPFRTFRQNASVDNALKTTRELRTLRNLVRRGTKKKCLQVNGGYVKKSNCRFSVN